MFGEFFTSLKDFIVLSWEYIKLFHIVQQYEHAIVLRLGRYDRTMSMRETGLRGLNFKWPLLEHVMVVNKTMTTMDVKPQSLTTRDDKSIIVAAVIKYWVIKPEVFLIEVEEAKDALADLAQGKIKEVIIAKDWVECKAIKDSELKAKITTEAEKWGIKVELITITNLAISRSIRIIR